MSDRVFDPEELRERALGWQRRVEELAADTRRLNERLGDLRLTVSDPNRMVEITIDSSGSLLDLQLSQRSQRVRVEEVSRTIMQTLGEAKRQIAEQASEVIESTLGTDSEAGRGIAEQMRRQLVPDDEDEGR